MKRVCSFVAILGGIVLCGSGEAWALPQFKKAFEGHYEVKSHPELKAAVKKAACNTCHVKGEPKTAQNGYGEALSKLIEGSAKERLDAAKAISKEEQKAELAKLVAEFEAALPQVEEKKNEDGETYGSRIKAGKLPVDLPTSDENEDDEAEEP